MRKIVLLLLLCSPLIVFSQQLTIKGNVMDTADNKPLSNATVSVIRKTDSVLVTFTRTRKDGSFLVPQLAKGEYRLLVTYPLFADYSDVITADKSGSVDLGAIPMIREAALLEEVVIKQQVASIKIRGDTLAYLADSFHVREGAAVEELLKKLPGIQVDRNGQVTAQGEKVEKILVDGEEFFADDPGVVLKNLGASTVKEVQVYDKKSDQAEFTGIDDGQRSKTINLALKPDKKKGYFGKATLGGGTRETFDNDLMFNIFKGKKKISAFGIMSNTGRGGLDWNDREKFGGGDNVQYDEDNGYFYMNVGDNDIDQQLRQDRGLPTTWTGGLHYSDKWDNDRKNLNLNYRILKRNLRSESSTLTQYILPDTQYFSNTHQRAFGTRAQNSLRGFYDLKFDSLTSVKITVNGSTSRSDNATQISNISLNADSGLVNQNERTLFGLQEKKNLNTDILFRKKFNTVGRTLSVTLRHDITEDDFDGSLVSETRYYGSSGNADSTENIDQKKNNAAQRQSLQTRVVYTEPLSKKTFLSVNYGFVHSFSDASRNSFNKNGQNGEYDIKDNTLSNDFEFRYNTHTVGGDFKLNTKKLNMTIGSGLGFADFLQTDLIRDSSRAYSFTNFFPMASIIFKPGPQKSVNFRYNGSTRPPTLDQLQPILENTNPLYLRIGNPGLRQAFEHRINLGAHTYKVLSETGFFGNLYANLTENAITTSNIVDAGGKTTAQFINMDGNYDFGAWAGFQKGFKKQKIHIFSNISVNNGKNNSMLNGVKNVNNYQNYSFGIHFNKRINDSVSFSIGPRISYTNSKSSLRPDVVTKYYTGNVEISADVNLPWKFRFNPRADLQIRQKTEVFARNLNVYKIDAALSRMFFKKNNGELKFSVFDLLDQNIGFNRYASGSVITEDSYLSLRRYFMLSFIYNITQNPK